MGAPGFWDDQATAARVSQEHARVTRRLDGYHRLERELADAAGAARARAPTSRARSASSSCRSARSSSACRRRRSSTASTTRATRSSRSPRARAAPTPRTGRRCCCGCTCAGRTGAASRPSSSRRARARRRASKSATLTVKGENAYGLFKAERGVHRLVRLSPFDSAHRRHTAFAQVVAAPLLPETRTSRSTRPSCASTPTARAAPAASTSTRPTRPCASRISRPGSSCSARTSARRRRTRRPRCGSSRRGSPRWPRRKREAELARERGAKVDVGFGSQIRSYVLHPYQLVKDHRTDFEAGNAQGVLDGSLDGFVQAYLLAKAAGKA